MLLSLPFDEGGKDQTYSLFRASSSFFQQLSHTLHKRLGRHLGQVECNLVRLDRLGRDELGELLGALVIQARLDPDSGNALPVGVRGRIGEEERQEQLEELPLSAGHALVR